MQWSKPSMHVSVWLSRQFITSLTLEEPTITDNGASFSDELPIAWEFYIAKWSINNLYQVVCFSSYILNLLDCPSDLRCANTAAWNVPADFQGDGVSSKWENCTQRPCCQKLHVSSTTQFSSMCSVLQHCCHYTAATLLQGCSTCGCVGFYHSNTAQGCV